MTNSPKQEKVWSFYNSPYGAIIHVEWHRVQCGTVHEYMKGEITSEVIIHHKRTTEWGTEVYWDHVYKGKYSNKVELMYQQAYAINAIIDARLEQLKDK